MGLATELLARYPAFEQAFLTRLEADGFVPASHRFPLAAHELGLLRFSPRLRVKAGRSFVVGVAPGEGLVEEQLRYLSDQFYNALTRETNELKREPTLLRGVCIFVYEREPEQKLVGFLMKRVRPRSPFAVIRSAPWIFSMDSGRVQKPPLTRAPFAAGLLRECAALARGAGSPRQG